MSDWDVFPREATATGMKAQEQGLARITISRDDLYAMTSQKMREAREMVELLMREGAIQPIPDA